MKFKITLAAASLALICAAMYLLLPTYQPLSTLESSEDSSEFVERSKLERIDQAFEMEEEKTRSPKGGVPTVKLLDAYETLKKKQAVMKAAKSPTVIWEERGPFNVGGRTRALLFDLTDPSNNTVLAGGVGGGVWRTTNFLDAAPTWSNSGDFLENLAITTIVQDPNNMQVFYAGTGEGWRNADAIQGIGVFKSTDGGLTFSHLLSSIDFKRVQSMAFDGNGNLLVATDKGIQRYDELSDTWETVLDMNGGTVTGTDLPEHNIAGDIEVSTTGDIYVSFGRIFAKGYIYKSSGTQATGNPGDAGTWVRTEPLLTAGHVSGEFQAQRINLALSPDAPNRIYALCEDPVGGPTGLNTVTDPAGVNASFIYRSDNGGTTWTQLAAPTFCDQGMRPNFTRSQAWYDLAITVNPQNADQVYIGGVDGLRSDNAGLDWLQITSWTGGNLCPELNANQEVHADQHVILHLPGENDKMVWATDGGIDYTENAQAIQPSFVSKNTGYNVTQFYACAMSNVVGSTDFIAGAQDNGTQRYTDPGVNTTVEVTGGDGAFCHVDQDEPNIQISSFVYNSYWVTTNSWQSDTRVSSGSSTGQFINPTDYDSKNNILYACNDDGMYLRMDNVGDGNNFTIVTAAEFGDGEITTIVLSPNTEHRFFCGTNSIDRDVRDDKLFVVDNANTNSPVITQIDNGQLPSGSGAYISSIAIEEGDDNHLLVTFSNFDQTSIYETFDMGANWTAVEGDLPNFPVRWVIFNPTNSDAALIATDLGVWTTDDLDGTSTSWNPCGEDSGFPNVRTDMLQVRPVDNFIIAATHGRGLWSTSGFGASVATLTFNVNTQSLVETTETMDIACNRGYKDISIPVTILKSTDAAAINFEVDAASTASVGSDFDILNTSNTLNFTGAGGLNEELSIDVRVYDDATVDGPENIIFNLTNIPSSLASGLFLQHELNIIDNDVDPALGTGEFALIETVDFSNGEFPTDWSVVTLDNTGSNTWDVGVANSMGSATAAVVTFTPGAGANDTYESETNAANTDSSNDVILMTNLLDTRGLTNVQLSFDWGAGGETDATNPFAPDLFDFGSLVYSLDGVNFIDLGERFVGAGAGAAVPVSDTYDQFVPELEGKQLYIGFRWINDPLLKGTFSFAVDNVRLVGTPKQIATTLAVATSKNVATADDVYFYDNTDGKLMVKLSNAASDLGCTSVSISEAGATKGDYSDGERASKKYNVTADNEAGYDISIYFTKAELQPFTDAGVDVSTLNMLKISSGNDDDEIDDNPIFAEVLDAGTGEIIGYKYTSSQFSTFSDFTVTTAITPEPKIGTVAVELLDFRANLVENQYTQLTWITSSETDNKGFEIERSLDGQNFSAIGYVNSQGNGNGDQKYTFRDQNLTKGLHYYRLNQQDFSGKSSLSKVLSVNVVNNNQLSFTVLPNPVSEVFNVVFSQEIEDGTILELLDMSGKRLRYLTLPKGLTNKEIDITKLQLAQGIYVLKMTSSKGIITQQIVKQ